MNCGPSRCPGGKISLRPSRCFRPEGPSNVNRLPRAHAVWEQRAAGPGRGGGPGGGGGHAPGAPRGAPWAAPSKDRAPIGQGAGWGGPPGDLLQPRERGAALVLPDSPPARSPPLTPRLPSRLPCPLGALKLPLQAPVATPRVCFEKTKTKKTL